MRNVWKSHYKVYVTIVTRAPAPVNNFNNNNDPLARIDAEQATAANADTFKVFISITSTANDLALKDVTAHWCSKLAKRNTKKIMFINMLAWMALDFLSAPGALINVKQFFSHSGLVISKHRSSLTAQLVCASTVLINQTTILGIIPAKKIIKIFNDKSKQGEKDGDGDVEMIEILLELELEDSNGEESSSKESSNYGD